MLQSSKSNAIKAHTQVGTWSLRKETEKGEARGNQRKASRVCKQRRTREGALTTPQKDKRQELRPQKRQKDRRTRPRTRNSRRQKKRTSRDCDTAQRKHKARLQGHQSGGISCVKTHKGKHPRANTRQAAKEHKTKHVKTSKKPPKMEWHLGR